MLERTASEFGDETALQIMREEGYYRISYAELLERAQALASTLARLGIQPKDRVGIWGENRPEWAISYIGIRNYSG